MKQKKGFKQYLVAVLLGVFGYAASYVPLIYIVLPAAYGCVGGAWGVGPLCLSLLVSAVGTLLAGGGAMSLAFYIPAALALGLMIRYKRPWRETASVTAATMFLGMYCVVCLPGVLSGDGPYAPLINGLKEVSEVFSAEFISLGALDYAEALQETVSNYIAIIPDSLLSSMLLTAMIWGGASLLVVRAILKKKCDIRPMAFFREWQLSKSFVIGCLILFAGGLILSLMELPYAAAVYSCAEIIAVVPLAVQGVCTFDFLWYFRRKNVVGRVIAILLLVFLLPISPMLFGVLGLLEQFMKLRFRLKETARNSPPNT